MIWFDCKLHGWGCWTLTIQYLIGLEHDLLFPHLGNDNPNRRTHIFQRGRAQAPSRIVRHNFEKWGQWGPLEIRPFFESSSCFEAELWVHALDPNISCWSWGFPQRWDSVMTVETSASIWWFHKTYKTWSQNWKMEETEPRYQGNFLGQPSLESLAVQFPTRKSDEFWNRCSL